jgi:hypothetical protein
MTRAVLAAGLERAGEIACAAILGAGVALLLLELVP